MIWIIGEYAERIENADELLETFLEAFPEETSMVQLQLVTATVKLFLKKPTERPQQMIQLVLTYATQVLSYPTIFHNTASAWNMPLQPPASSDQPGCQASMGQTITACWYHFIYCHSIRRGSTSPQS